MTESDFASLARQGFTRVPVVLEARADLYTPLAVYLKLADGPFTYLLESVVGGDRFGRYSFVGDNEIRFNPPGRQYDTTLMMDCSQCPIHPQLKDAFHATVKKYAETLRKARFDDDVKAVVLRIDSGGGSMMASEVIRQEVAALEQRGWETHPPFAGCLPMGNEPTGRS